MHAGAPDETVVAPEVAELDALELDALELDALELDALELDALELGPAAALDALEVASAAALDAPALVALADVTGGVEEVQPAARSPTLSSGTTSNAFFTRSPDGNGKRCADTAYDAAAPHQVGRIVRWGGVSSR